MRARNFAVLIILVLIFMGPRPGHAQKDPATEIANQATAKIDEFADFARKIAEARQGKIEQFEEATRALAEKSKEKIREGSVKAAQTLLKTGQAAEKQSLETPAPKKASASSPKDTSRIFLFVTLGPDPDSRLEQNRRLFQELPPGTEVVLRGLPQGKRSLGDLFRYIHKLSGEMIRSIPKDKLPLVLLDPRLYLRYQVTVSPTLVYERDGKAVAWVRGLVNGQWLKDQVEKDKRTGDLGKYGPTEDIAERDFLEEIQERLASVDWDAKQEKAWSQYWTHYSFFTLPPAAKDRTFQVEAAYKVPQDFILPGGQVLARKGEKINLFDKVKPRFVLLVFDASDSRQLAWAKKEAGKCRGHYRVKYLTTALPERTWDSFSKVEDQLEAPLYLLNDAVRDRFRLEYVPSLVRPLEDRFEVREFGLKKGQGEGDVSPTAQAKAD